MNKQETIADIVAEMRGLVKPGETLNHTYELLNGLADRIDAAVKRECIEVATRAATQGVNLTNEKYANTPIGNTVAMREALIQARAAICESAKYLCQSLSWVNSDIQANCADVLCPRRGLCKAKTAINAALAAPPRNCDKFGTDNAEASLAYEEFCDRAEVEESVNGAIAWLLSLDADKKGGAK